MDDYEQDENRRVCRTCRRFVGLGGCDRDTLHRLHLRYDDLEAVMEGAGICDGSDGDEAGSPSLVLAEDGTCGEWEGQVNGNAYETYEEANRYTITTNNG